VSLTAPGAGAADLLTRTTLQLSALAMIPLVLFAAGSLVFQNGAVAHWPILFCCVTIAMLALFRRGA
jgi:hypothetical protein